MKKKLKPPTKLVPREKGNGKEKVKAKGKVAAAGPKSPKKHKGVDEGLGTVRVKLTDADIAARGLKLARKLNEREIEVAAQSEAKKLMSGNLDKIDAEIHRLQTAMRERVEEQPAPGLFDDKPVAEDTMGKTLDKLDEKGKPESDEKPAEGEGVPS